MLALRERFKNNEFWVPFYTVKVPFDLLFAQNWVSFMLKIGSPFYTVKVPFDPLFAQNG